MNEIQKIKECNEENENINSPTFLKFNMVGDGLFYLIKKKQISLLYLGNILCTFFEFGFDFVITFILKDNPNNYIYYSYFFLCFIHNSIIFISFYWLIKGQYNKKIKTEINLYDDDESEDNLINDKYIN